MPRHLPSGHRRAITLLELLVVLVLLGLSAAVVLPTLRLPAPAAAESPLVRARTLALRRGEAVRLNTDAEGRWTVRATADALGAILLEGDGVASPIDGSARSVVISALGTCLPEGAPVAGSPAWDPVRCAVTAP